MKKTPRFRGRMDGDTVCSFMPAVDMHFGLASPMSKLDTNMQASYLFWMQKIITIQTIIPLMLPGKPFKVICFLSSNLLTTTDWTIKPLIGGDSTALMYLNTSEHLNWPSLDVIHISLKRRAHTGFRKACGIKLRYRLWYNALQHLKWPQKFLTV